MKKLLSVISVALLMAGCGSSEEAVQEEAKDDPSVPLLIPCEACGKEVSKKTEKCLSCGHPAPDSVVAYREAQKAMPKEGKPFTVPGLSMEMIWVEPGTFTMGSPSSEAGRQSDREDEHTVILTKGFYLGKYEVTQAQWESIMGSNPSRFKGPNLPVETVSWDDAVAFCEKLTERESKAGRLPEGWEYALPTEAQWEYACRAGTKTAYSFGGTTNLLYRHTNYADKNTDFDWSDKSHDDGHAKTASVGSYPANAWGFHDMHGNVWEWTADWYQAAYPTGNVTDPTGPASGSHRVDRGGSWGDDGRHLRSAGRNARHATPRYRFYTLGFRVGFQKQ